MKFITASIFSVLLFSSISFSQGKVQRYNPFSGTIVFSVEGGITLANTDYAGLGIDYLGRASLEYFFPSSVQSGFGLRLFGSTGFIKGDDGNCVFAHRSDLSYFEVYLKKGDSIEYKIERTKIGNKAKEIIIKNRLNKRERNNLSIS